MTRIQNYQNLNANFGIQNISNVVLEMLSFHISFFSHSQFPTAAWLEQHPHFPPLSLLLHKNVPLIGSGWWLFLTTPQVAQLSEFQQGFFRQIHLQEEKCVKCLRSIGQQFSCTQYGLQPLPRGTNTKWNIQVLLSFSPHKRRALEWGEFNCLFTAANGFCPLFSLDYSPHPLSEQMTDSSQNLTTWILSRGKTRKGPARRTQARWRAEFSSMDQERQKEHYKAVAGFPPPPPLKSFRCSLTARPVLC